MTEDQAKKQELGKEIYPKVLRMVDSDQGLTGRVVGMLVHGRTAAQLAEYSGDEGKLQDQVNICKDLIEKADQKKKEQDEPTSQPKAALAAESKAWEPPAPVDERSRADSEGSDVPQHDSDGVTHA